MTRMAKKKDISKRKTHKRAKAGKTGSLAELHDVLVKEGFSYQYKAGDPSYFDTGKASYASRRGLRVLLKRIEKGKPPRWTGAKTGLVRLAATADVWQLIRKRK